MHLDEAVSIAGEFLELTLLRLASQQGANLEKNSTVFRILCTGQIVMGKLRVELVSRSLCPLSIHSLCGLFAVVYCDMSSRVQF